MERHRLSLLHRSVGAVIALSLVLAGTAYASVSVAQHLTAGITCGGKCPVARDYWAYIQAKAPVGTFASSPNVEQTALGGVPAQVYQVGTGNYIVRFTGDNLTNCARFVNLTDTPGYAVVDGYGTPNSDPTAIPVQTYGPQGNLINADFVVGVFCGGGIGATDEIGG